MDAPTSPITFEEFWVARYAEKHAAARAKESQLHDEAFTGCTHTVCALELRGMTCYDLLLLHGCSNPFIVGGQLVPAAIAQFLAVLVQPAPSSWWSRRKFFRHIARYPYPDAVAEIKAYVSRFISQVSTRSLVDDTETPEVSPPLNMCFLAPLVIRVAAETGWSESDILSMRVDRLFQYDRAAELRKGGKDSLARSDRLLSEALAEYNVYLQEFLPAS